MSGSLLFVYIDDIDRRTLSTISATNSILHCINRRLPVVSSIGTHSEPSAYLNFLLRFVVDQGRLPLGSRLRKRFVFNLTFFRRHYTVMFVIAKKISRVPIL